jgi:hypothetical protein
MTLKTSLIAGFFGGAIVGGGITLLDLAPSVVAVLAQPLKWLTQGLHPFPTESPANIAVALPLMFLYWGCIGIVLMLLIRSLMAVFAKKGGK